MNSIMAIFLDMDGVIVDSEPIHVESFRLFLKKRSVIAKDDFLYSLIGHSVEKNIKDIYKTFPDAKGSSFEKDLKDRESIYLKLLSSSNIYPAPGLEDLIFYCQTCNISLGLTSSSVKEQIQVVLEKLTDNSPGNINYMSIFSVIVSGDEVRQKKPAPDIYLTALQKLGLHASTCLAIEDSPAGIESAKSAGLYCFAVKTDYIHYNGLRQADRIITSLKDVPGLI